MGGGGVKGKIIRKERNEKVQVRACAHACVRAGACARSCLCVCVCVCVCVCA